MPCYTVQTASVELNNADHELLAKALEKQGYKVQRVGKTLTFSKGNVTGTYSNKKIDFRMTGGAKVDTDAIKREYSKQVIEHMAKKYAEDGWELTQDGDEYTWSRPSSGYGAVFA